MEKSHKWIIYFLCVLIISIIPLLFQHFKVQQTFDQHSKRQHHRRNPGVDWNRLETILGDFKGPQNEKYEKKRDRFDSDERHKIKTSDERHKFKPRDESDEHHKFKPRDESDEHHKFKPRDESDEHNKFKPRDESDEHHKFKPRDESDERHRADLPKWANSATECGLQIVETIPDGVFTDKELRNRHVPMHEAWVNLFDMAKSRIEIVSYHWGLQRGSFKGQSVFDSLKKAVVDRGVKLSIIHTSNHTEDERYDTVDLMKLAKDLVSVRSITMPKLIAGGGVLHSKLLVSDRKHFYIGSANLSDRGLSKTKEMGILVTNCPRLAQDAAILFEVYWELGGREEIPHSWPTNYYSRINLVSPLMVKNTEDGMYLKTFLGSSPPVFCPEGRTDDLTIIKHAINTAERFIYVAVADYIPMNVFGKIRRSWTVLDDLLREAVLKRDIKVRMILSERVYTMTNRKKFLFSLMDLNKIKKDTFVEVKVFHAELAHFKSAHNKYFVTDRLGYIGTSNWSQDYYTRTAGVGFAMESLTDGEAKEVGQPQAKDLRQQLVDVFERDWKSPHCRIVK